MENQDTHKDDDTQYVPIGLAGECSKALQVEPKWVDDSLPPGFRTFSNALGTICANPKAMLNDLDAKHTVDGFRNRILAPNAQVLGRRNGVGPRVPITLGERMDLWIPLAQEHGLPVCAGPDQQRIDPAFIDVVVSDEMLAGLFNPKIVEAYEESETAAKDGGADEPDVANPAHRPPNKAWTEGGGDRFIYDKLRALDEEQGGLLHGDKSKIERAVQKNVSGVRDSGLTPEAIKARVHKHVRMMGIKKVKTKQPKKSTL